MQSGTCFPIFVGGSALADGMTVNSLAPQSCSKLRCTKCDKRVVRFQNNVAWKESVDYLFVRNHNTNIAKLETGC